MSNRMEKKLNLFEHVCGMSDDRVPCVWNTGGSNSRGRPRRRWIDDVEE